MSDKNGETSTFEMETRENFNKILQAISGMRQDFSQRFDKIEAEQVELRKELSEQRKEFTEFKDYVEVQFEAIRQGLVKNYNRLDLLESQIAENRMVIFSTKAIIGELHERVYLLSRSNEPSLK
jgi:predicted  nucleic acid-binding Zn-ribbon protein